MSDLCIIYNFAQLYRTAIFKAIDEEWKCQWFFGENTTDIKSMNKGILKKEHYVSNNHLIGPLYWQKGVCGLIDHQEFDDFILLGELYCLSTWWILIKKRLCHNKKRIFLWSHGWYGRESFLKKILKRLFFGMADAVFTYGEYAKKEAEKQKFDGNKIKVIHNSLNHSYQVELRNRLHHSQIYSNYFKNKFPTLIFIGRLTKVKKLNMLLDALSRLKKRGEEYNLVFIGDGEDRLNLENQVINWGIKKNVWFYGGCYDDTKNAQLIYDADLCVAPGNVGLTAMHTMVFGCPVLTHDDFTLQMPEFEAITPEKTGAFFRYGDVKSLADAISTWFKSHGDEREQIREWCYQEIDNNWTPKYQIKVLKSVLNSNESI